MEKENIFSNNITYWCWESVLSLKVPPKIESPGAGIVLRFEMASLITVPVQWSAALLPIQFPTVVSGEVVESGPGTWVPAIMIED